MRTAEVRLLFQEALGMQPVPFGEDVIEDVFLTIERHPRLMNRYTENCDRLSKTVVNTWGAWWVGHTVGRSGRRTVRAKSALIKTYSKL